MEHTPFHAGELALQDKLGVKDMVHSYAPRVIRPFMPDQHRMFYTSLPYFFMGSVDEEGWPWASVLFGEPGFVSSPSPTMLSLTLLPDADDPLSASLMPGREVGMVGLQLETRRRNRVNGRIEAVQKNGFDITVTQSFGNCPQYIQKRNQLAQAPVNRGVQATSRRPALNADDMALIEAADTFYIASASGDLGLDEKHGVDMSHRGGASGFVKILEGGSILFPDFSGNNHYNTFGNIMVNPVVGLLFIDYEKGDLLQLTGQAEIIWPEDTPYTYEGALKYVRIKPNMVVSRTGAVPFVLEHHEDSPYLPHSSWVAQVKAPAPKGEMSFKVADIVREADDINSYYLMPEHGSETPPFKAGQHLPIAVEIDGTVVRRTYTVSSAPRHGGAIRLSIKSLVDGQVSGHLASQLKIGGTIKALAPGGDFFLESKTGQASVFISAGIGITPMMAMAETLLDVEGDTPIHFLHASRTVSGTAFLPEMRRWQQQYAHFNLGVTLDANEAENLGGIPGVTAGRMDARWLSQRQLPKNGAFYLCGPQGFMQMVYDWLIAEGVEDDQIFFEAFGPSTLTRNIVAAEKVPTNVPVRFEGIEKLLAWNVAEASLLELAEDNGIDAPFSCRSGSCGSCVVKLLKGKVSYDKEPAFPLDETEALLCCAVPNTDNLEEELVLEL